MKRKLLITLLALTAALCCTIGLTACNGFGGFGGLGGTGEGKFTLSNVKKIKLNDYQSQVVQYLGEADETNGTQLVYYGSNYKTTIAEQEKLEEQMLNISSEDELEKLLEKMVKLEESLQTMKYECLTVNFNNQIPAYVTSVVYDAAKCEANPNPEKQSKEIKLSDTGALLYTSMTFFNMTAAISYTDFSYKLVTVPSSALTGLDNTLSTAQTLNWEDDWGSYSPQFSFLREYSVTGGSSGNNIKYTFKIEDGDTAENHSTVLRISGSGQFGYYNAESDAFRKYGSNVKKIIMEKNTTSYTYTIGEFFRNVEDIVIESGTKIIGNDTFAGCQNLKSVTVPASVKTFCVSCFANCPALTDINYGGTKAQWKAIERQIRDDLPDSERTVWNYKTENYTVHCTDGDLDYQDNEI